MINGQDYTDLMPIVLRHEMEEIWAYLESDYNPDPKSEKMTSDLAHNLALRKEYEYAFEIGESYRYAQFIIEHIKENSSLSIDDRRHIIAENKTAYDAAKLDYEKKHNLV